MRGTDRVLLLILGGIAIVVVAAFAVIATRPAPQYRTDSSPEAAVHNYLLALKNEDFAQAHRYLSPELTRYPATPEQMTTDIDQGMRTIDLDSDHALSVLASDTSSDSATVTALETVYRNRGLFENSQYDREITFSLIMRDDTWQIVDADYYWVWCWSADEAGSTYKARCE